MHKSKHHFSVSWVLIVLVLLFIYAIFSNNVTLFLLTLIFILLVSIHTGYLLVGDMRKTLSHEDHKFTNVKSRVLHLIGEYKGHPIRINYSAFTPSIQIKLPSKGEFNRDPVKIEEQIYRVRKIGPWTTVFMHTVFTYTKHNRDVVKEVHAIFDKLIARNK